MGWPVWSLCQDHIGQVEQALIDADGEPESQPLGLVAVLGPEAIDEPVAPADEFHVGPAGVTVEGHRGYAP
jgi:hypothetical protein